MKVCKSMLLLLVSLFLVTGCVSTNANISAEDMAVVKSSDKKAVVKYGMSRSDAENILGKGEKTFLGFEYNDGVIVMYRDDQVVGVSLSEDSKGIYTTSNNIGIGMLEDDIKKQYGDQYMADQSNGGFLTYYYDTDGKAFLKDKSPTSITQENSQKIYVITIAFDENGYADRIMLLDHLMAVYMR